MANTTRFGWNARDACLALACCLGLVAWQAPAAGDEPNWDRVEDVIYGRKFGTALTLDVFKPKDQSNGRGLIWVVSGGWFSSHQSINTAFVAPFTARGYTVFAVVHGSQPKFTIPEVLDDMHRAVRFVRFKAKSYGIDPERLGIYGGSAGGHLSLMQGVAGLVENESAVDPIDRQSSRVRAVACFFPPTDFLNYGEPGENALGRGVLAKFRAPFDFHEHDKETNAYLPITDEDRILKIGRQISPVYHVTPDDPPTLVIHGDADKLVPIQQAELMVDKLRAAKVDAELTVRPGAAHGWPKLADDLELFADWFGKHLK